MRYVYEENIIEEDTGWIGGDDMIEGARALILERRPSWERARQIYPMPETSIRPKYLTR